MSFADPSISARAREAYDAGERGLAEAICRLQLRLGVEGEVARGAWELLATIARDVGRWDVEEQYLERARREGKPSVAPSPRSNTHGPRPAGTKRKEPGFLLIRAWGQGFFADVDHVLGQLLLAEITGRTPLVWWGAESRFGDGGKSNAWERYFEPVSNLTMESVIARASSAAAPQSFFPARWNGTNLRDVHLPLLDPPASRPAPVDVLPREEDIVVSTMHGAMAMTLPWTHHGHWLHGSSVPQAFAGLARKYLKPTPRMTALVDAAHQELFAQHQGGRVIAIHLRGCDKSGEDPAIARSCNQVIARAEADLRTDPACRVLILTDSEPMVVACRQRFQDLAIFTRVQRSAKNVGLHFDRALDGRTLGDEVLSDVLLATRCDAFIGVGSSNVSTAVSYLKDWNGACELIGERYFERVNPMVYL